MHDDLNRVELAVSATASGNLTWGLWPLDVATAMGFAGQRNPLGFAVVRYLSGEPSASSVWGVILNLATALVAIGHDSKSANDAAWLALDAWNNSRCPTCGGRGVLNIEQRACHVCNGTGERDLTCLSAIVNDGVAALAASERWMEGQLNARLRR